MPVNDAINTQGAILSNFYFIKFIYNERNKNKGVL